MVIFTGIPDFKAVADAYLKRKKGIISRVFDLENVYRYTHGNPEGKPEWWQEQLHKSLFDKQSLTDLLRESGFESFVLFTYCFGTEKLPVSMGFIAFKKKTVHQINRKWIADKLKGIAPYINFDTLRIA